MRRAVAVVMIALCAVVAVSATAPAAAPRSSLAQCGTVTKGGVPLYNITGTWVGCALARRTARGWLSRVFARRCENGRFRCTVGAFTCRAKRPARVDYHVNCRDGSRRVRWEVVVD
jgi:hypothetical protein